ncbi:hypothetical protein BR93DRAFT_403673 [Coniochaeta sp. PMI_546]|nr:hypothetical protein BR93DRAFT_403673 [Coniochaeta sp. PMI_546]
MPSCLLVFCWSRLSEWHIGACGENPTWRGVRLNGQQSSLRPGSNSGLALHRPPQEGTEECHMVELSHVFEGFLTSSSHRLKQQMPHFSSLEGRGLM